LPSAVRLLSADGAVAVRLEVDAPMGLPAFDRAALDLAFRDVVLSAGAAIYTGRSVTAVEPHAERGWSIVDQAGARTETAVVVDASGKTALTSGKLIAVMTETAALDPRSSVFTHYERTEPFGIDAVTLVADAGGFFYLVPLHARRLCVGRVRYAEGKADSAAFDAAIEVSAPVRELVQGAVRVLPLIPAKNAASRAIRAALPGLFVTGDALGFRDPFMWDGLHYALASGRAAGEWAAAVAQGRRNAAEAAAAYSVDLHNIEQGVTVATEAALAPYAAALAPAMLLDPHMPPPLLAALLGLTRAETDAGAHWLLRQHRDDVAQRRAA